MVFRLVKTDTDVAVGTTFLFAAAEAAQLSRAALAYLIFVSPTPGVTIADLKTGGGRKALCCVAYIYFMYTLQFGLYIMMSRGAREGGG